jgi:hypothetical protein
MATINRLTYSRFYQLFGINQLNELSRPKANMAETFQLPLGAVYHYTAFDGICMGPLPNDPAFAGVTQSIPVYNETDVLVVRGAPRRQNDAFAPAVKNLRTRNRRLKILHDPLDLPSDPKALVVYNYAIIAGIYRYTRNAYTEYYRWYNIMASVVERIKTLLPLSERQQFIVSPTLMELPSLAQLDACLQELPQGALKIFRTPQSYLLLEIWRWLSEQRGVSLFSDIPKDKLQYVNIVYQNGPRWSVINLGYLDCLRKDSSSKDNRPTHIQVAKTDHPEPMDARSVQKRFLLLMMRLSQTASQMGADSGIHDEPKADNAEDAPPVEDAGWNQQNRDSGEVPQIPGKETTIELKNIAIDDVSDDSAEQKEMSEAEKNQQETEIDEEINRLNQIATARATDKPVESADQIINKPAKDPAAAFMEVLDKHAQSSTLSAAEYNRFKLIGEKYKTLPGPDGTGTLQEAAIVDQSKLTLDPKKAVYADSDSVLDKTMLRSTLENLDEAYVRHGLPKHITANVLALQNAGVAVTEYTKETISDILGDYEIHTVRVAPIEGGVSTLNFRIPVIDEGGCFKANNTVYRLRRQISDLPIRKIGSDEVALTSYYGKSFVQRGRKSASNFTEKLADLIMAEQFSDAENKKISDVKVGDVFDNEASLPKVYTALSMRFIEITVQGVRFVFDHKAALSTFDKDVLQAAQKLEMTALGYSEKRAYFLDDHGQVYAHPKGDYTKQPQEMGSLIALMGIDESILPVECAEIKIFSKYVPVAVYLSYHYGLSELLKVLGVEPDRRMAGERRRVDPYTQWELTFADETWVFEKGNTLANMVLAGWRAYAKAIKLYAAHSFDSKAVYYNVLDANGLTARYMREMDTLDMMFVDPITLDVLKKLKLPQTFEGLVLKACELLLKDEHPDEMDFKKGMRLKSQELVAGAIYTELANSVRTHHAQPGKATKRVELNPYAVWKRIVEDPVKIQLSEMNPLMDLKEKESATFSGTQGRNSRSMTKDTRVYHPSFKGIISEGTVDSSDVGLNVVLAPNPKIQDVYGIPMDYDYAEDGMTSTISSSVLMASGSDTDDMRRAGFVSIQNAHTVACNGYHQATVRTGYDTVIGQRTGDKYCITAKQPGKVKDVSEHGVVVSYEDGTEVGYETGTQYGKASGLVIPHRIITDLKPGVKVMPGDAIIYNTGFFEPDFFDPKRVVYKGSKNLRTVLWEANDTLEDASVLSRKAADELSTQTTKVKTITVPFSTAVHNLLTAGTQVQYDSVLCVMQDEVSANAGAFDESTMDNLSRLSSQSPRAGCFGTLERIEVYYHGDLEDMHPTLQALASRSNKALAAKAKALGKKVYTGSVDSGFRIDGSSLEYNHVAIQVYMTTTVTTGVGDKNVFSHQLKSVASQIVDEPYVSLDGKDIDAAYGAQSVSNRVVNSAYSVGTANNALMALQEAMIKAYEGK